MPRLNCRSIVKRCVASLGLIAAAALAGSSGAHAAPTATVLCVGGPRCYPTVQSALDASENGDTIKVGPGTFAGGIAITKSISLIGSGAGATVVRGGGPRDHDRPELYRPDAQRLDLATDDHRRREHNHSGFLRPLRRRRPHRSDRRWTRRTSSRSATASSPATRSGAEGGGIADIGQLTLTNSIVSSNEAGSAAGQHGEGRRHLDGKSRPGGLAGIQRLADDDATTSSPATSLRRTAVTASASKAAASRCKTGRRSRSPTASSAATAPATRAVATPRPTYLSTAPESTSVTAAPAVDRKHHDQRQRRFCKSAPLGEPTAASAGLVVGAEPARAHELHDQRKPRLARCRLDRRSRTERQRLRVRCERDDLERSRRRTTAPRSRSRPGSQVRPEQFFPSTRIRRLALLSNSVISGNSVTVASATGSATIQGVGITNNGELELRNDLISGNTGTALAPSGFAQGGGIWNGEVFAPPPLSLLVQDSAITGNLVTGSPGVNVSGGGIFTTSPITLAHSLVAGNRPNQCTGC